MSEIPPYQSIDLALGSDKGVTIKPVAGFVVTYPDRHLDAEFVKEDCDIDALKAKSKWPDSVFIRPCWIHSEQNIQDEGISDRKYWTPR